MSQPYRVACLQSAGAARENREKYTHFYVVGSAVVFQLFLCFSFSFHLASDIHQSNPMPLLYAFADGSPYTEQRRRLRGSWAPRRFH